IVFESIGFFSPGFTDGFERRESIQSLETLGEVVGVEEYLHVLAKLVVAVVVVAPNSRLFESTVHPLEPARSSKDDLALSADPPSFAPTPDRPHRVGAHLSGARERNQKGQSPDMCGA